MYGQVMPRGAAMMEMNDMTLADKINQALDNGLSVTVATYLRATKVKAKHRQQWRDAGYEFFKTEANGANVMIAGQKNGKPYYLCIDCAKVTAQ